MCWLYLNLDKYTR